MSDEALPDPLQTLARLLVVYSGQGAVFLESEDGAFQALDDALERRDRAREIVRSWKTKPTSPPGRRQQLWEAKAVHALATAEVKVLRALRAGVRFGGAEARAEDGVKSSLPDQETDDDLSDLTF